jgi:hypothetical protein
MEGETSSSEQHRLSHWFNNGGMVQDIGFRTEPPRIGSISQTEDVHGLSKTIRDSPLSGTHEVFLRWLGWLYCSVLSTRSCSQVEWRRNPSHSSPWLFYSHVSGLTLVTHENACIPPTRVSLACSPFARNLG